MSGVEFLASGAFPALVVVSTPPLREEPVPKWEPSVPGAQLRRMVEGNGAAIVLYRLDPGSRFDLHTHEYSELGVLLSGEGFFLLKDERRLVRGGDSFFIPPRTPHGFEVLAGDTPVIMMNVSVTVPSDALAPSTSAVVRSSVDPPAGTPPRPQRRRPK